MVVTGMAVDLKSCFLSCGGYLFIYFLFLGGWVYLIFQILVAIAFLFSFFFLLGGRGAGGGWV